MIEKAIRDLHSGKTTPPRFCDVIVDGDQIFLELKEKRPVSKRISWDDVVYQVEAARAVN
jgi:hypothetical protein